METRMEGECVAETVRQKLPNHHPKEIIILKRVDANHVFGSVL